MFAPVGLYLSHNRLGFLQEPAQIKELFPGCDFPLHPPPNRLEKCKTKAFFCGRKLSKMLVGHQKTKSPINFRKTCFLNTSYNRKMSHLYETAAHLSFSCFMWNAGKEMQCPPQEHGPKQSLGWVGPPQESHSTV